MGLRVAIFTVGCRANQADSERLARALDPRSVKVVDERDRFDLAVVNTCCVTARAESDCRRLARRARRLSPGARVVVTGCAVSAIEGFGDGLLAGAGVETVGGGDRDPRLLARWINDLAGGPLEEAARDGVRNRRTRALLKVQNGCSHGCAYCVVPAARGSEVSMPLAEVIEQAARLADEGYTELVLTGVQLGAWGFDLPGRLGIADLVFTVAERFTPGRVRLSSIEPWSVDEALLDVVAGHDRVCPHLHVPIQSGDDRVLEAMGRGYTSAEVTNLLQRALERVPDLALGTDLMCGFPGEDDRAFAGSIDLVRRLGLAYVHVFPFSPRPGTRAVEMPGRASDRQIRDRVAAAIATGGESKRGFRERQVGRECEVIVERSDGSVCRGLTDGYVPVVIADVSLRPGQLVSVRVERVDARGRVHATRIDRRSTVGAAVEAIVQ